MKGEERHFLEGCKKGHHIARLSLGWYKRWKSLPFGEIWNNPTPTLFFIRPPYKRAMQNMEFYDKLVDRFQDLSKVRKSYCQQGQGLIIISLSFLKKMFCENYLRKLPNLTAFLDICLYLKSKNNGDSVKHV